MKGWKIFFVKGSVLQISVLMSVHCRDNPKFLDEALDSILNQTLKPNEIVIVFDGNLPFVLKDCVLKFTKSVNIVVIELPFNVGLGGALREGLKVCKNDFVARMDSDDISLPNRFEEQVKVLINNEFITVVGTGIIEIDAKKNMGMQITYPQNNSDCLDFFQKRDPLAHPSVMFRKSFIEKIGSYKSLRKDQDTELWSRVFLAGGKIYNIPEPLLLFRRTETFFDKRSNLSRLIDFFKLRSKINRRLRFGVKGKLFLLFYCFVMLLPVPLKKKLYSLRQFF